MNRQSLINFTVDRAAIHSIPLSSGNGTQALETKRAEAVTSLAHGVSHGSPTTSNKKGRRPTHDVVKQLCLRRHDLPLSQQKEIVSASGLSF